MEKNLNFEKISKDKFVIVQQDTKIFDKPPETKPVGFYADAFRRFKKNKASVAGALIILFLVLFSIITPWVSKFSLAYYDTMYGGMPPKNIFSKAMRTESLGIQTYEKRIAIGVGANDFHLVGKPAGTPVSTIQDGLASPYAAVKELVESKLTPHGTQEYTVKTDVYKAVGFVYGGKLTDKEYNDAKAWQDETGLPLLYPVLRTMSGTTNNDMNIWYKVDIAGRAIYDAEGKFIPEYLVDKNGNYTDRAPSGEVRILAENWFIYTHGTAPKFVLGTDGAGRDILIRLAMGIRTSIFLATSITVVCFIIGVVIGALQGYYGGSFDMIMERLMDIWGGIPFFVILVLARQNWINTGMMAPVVALFLLYVSRSWMGNAGLMRAQFYRFKNKEYVMAARTLGARDRRLMFKHVFPNTLGTVITSCALDIPSFIFGETQLSYLGILNLDTPTTASIGGMISEGQKVMYNNPNVIFWPAFIIALLMISFNLFGNGLRDAFNPQLRGVEE